MKPKRFKLLKYSPFIVLTAMILTHAFTASAREGDRGGNGGMSIACRDSSGALTRVQLLDLVEFPGLIPESDEDPQTQFDRAVERLREAGAVVQADLIQRQWKWLAAHKVYTPAGTSLGSTHDGNHVFGSNGSCREEQLAAYRFDLEALFIDPELYNLLKPTDVAAFQLHDAIYKSIKEEVLGPASNGDSISTRKLVRALLNPASSLAEIRGLATELLRKRSGELEKKAADFYKGPTSPSACSTKECSPRDIAGSYLFLTGGTACLPSVEISGLGTDRMTLTSDELDNYYTYKSANPVYGIRQEIDQALKKLVNADGGETVIYGKGRVEPMGDRVRFEMEESVTYGKAIYLISSRRSSEAIMARKSSI